MDNAFCWRKDKLCKEPVYVVDWQATKIDNCNHSFFCYSTNFKKLGNSVLANSIFEYIMTKNVDGEGKRVLNGFKLSLFYIQSLDKGDANKPISEEGIKIKETCNSSNRMNCLYILFLQKCCENKQILNYKQQNF